jgi:uncharacterized membrane protein
VTDYPPVGEALLGVPGVYATTTAVAAGMWIAAVLVGRAMGGEDATGDLLAVGYGAAIPPLLVVLLVAAAGNAGLAALLRAVGVLIVFTVFDVGLIWYLLD